VRVTDEITISKADAPDEESQRAAEEEEEGKPRIRAFFH